MQTTPNQKLLEWVRKFRADLTPEGTITRVELYHAIDGEMGERLATFEMADRDEDEDPDDFAQEIWDEAEDDASTQPTGSFQRYIVKAYRGDTREPDEQKSFTTTGKLVTALTGNGSEPPTHRGEIMQGMRERGDLHNLVVRLCEATSGSAAVQLQRERDENNRLREVGYKYEQLRQELLDKSLERDLARKDAENSAQQMSMLWGTLIQLAPVVLSRILAPPPVAGAALPLQPMAPQPGAPSPGAQSPGAPHAHPGPTDPTVRQPAGTVGPEANQASAPVNERDRAMADLLATIKPEQMNKLIGAFDEQQMQTFLAVYTSYRDHPPSDASAAAPGVTPSN
jgi:hypothetical protein